MASVLSPERAVRRDVWRIVALATPPFFYAFAQSLPLYPEAMTPFESQLLNVGWLCLFFSPAFLPWVVRGAVRTWSLASRPERVALLGVTAVTAAVAFQATQTIIGYVYPHGLERWL